MPRFRVLLVVIAACLAALALAACGGGGEEDPREVLDRATFEGIESADFDASLEIRSKGKQTGNIKVDLSGRAQSDGLAVSATVAGTAQGRPIDVEGGLTLLDDHGFVAYKGTDYEIDPSTYGFAKEIFFPVLSREAAPELAACREAAARLEAGDLATGLRREGPADVAGTETTKISGELDVPTAVTALTTLAENLGCSVQFEALSPLGLSEVRELGDELSGSVNSAEVEVYVGDDDIVRRVSAELTGDLGGGREPVTVELELTLSEVNAGGKIEVPAEAKPILVLFGKLGVEPLEFLSWRRGGEGIRSLGEKVVADAFPAAAR
jgi:hypothetical protein